MRNAELQAIRFLGSSTRHSQFRIPKFSLSLLVQFALRLAFGLALAMALVPPRQVTSGYYRNHLYVLLGLNTLAAAMAWLRPDDFPHLLWLAMAGMAVSYVGAVCWLYELAGPGIMALVVVALLALGGAELSLQVAWNDLLPGEKALWFGDPPTAGLLLGATMAAMLLGHWYLNAPGMKLEPLRRLILLIAIAVALRAVVSGLGLTLVLLASGIPPTTTSLFLSLRWLAGIFAPAMLAWMTWQTLKIPNTQSATGILYVAVIVVYIGELASLMLSAELGLPM